MLHGYVARCMGCILFHTALAPAIVYSVGVFEGAAMWHAAHQYAAHVQDHGTVASISAGTLKLDGNTIVNTASTTVRTVARLGAIEVAVVTRALSEKGGRIGAGRQRRAEI